MKRTLGTAIGICLVAGLGVATTVAPAQAAAKYGSCASLKKAYPDGVAMSGSAASAAVKKGFTRPAVDKAVYTANKKLGQGGAGFVCATKAAPKPAPTPTPTAPQPVTYSVRILLHEALFVLAAPTPDFPAASANCASGGPYYVLWKDGVQVGVKDAAGVIVGTAALAGGTASNPRDVTRLTYDIFGRISGAETWRYYDCEWTSTVTVPVSPFYTISVASDTSTPLSQADIAKDGNMIFIEYDYTG